MRFPFEVSFAEIQRDPEPFVDAVFGSLESEFMVMPRGKGFVEFSTFEAGYETLKRATGSFHVVTPETVTPAVHDAPVVMLVLRCMLGFTPPEWATYATNHTGVEVTQSAARTIDRSVRMSPEAASAPSPVAASPPPGRRARWRHLHHRGAGPWCYSTAWRRPSTAGETEPWAAM